MVATEYPITLTIAAMVSSMTDERDPKAHADIHKSGGEDSIKLDELATPDDNTVLDASTAKHGLCPKLSGVATEFLNGAGAFSSPAGGGSAITYPGSSSVYLDGSGAFSSPAASGSVFKPGIYIGPSGSAGATYTCPGSADQTIINSALTAAPNGSTVYFLPGNYYITGRIISQYKSINIIGLGEVNIYKSVAEAVSNGIYIEGRIITQNMSVMASAAKGATAVTVSSGTSILAGDIIKIWNDDLWCPLDYTVGSGNPQYTGEMYRVTSKNGNIITLSEPLLRAYNTTDAAKINVYRPIEVHIENIKILDYDDTATHSGISIRYCVNSSISNCEVWDSGLDGISVYSSYNVDIYNNKVHNSVKVGSGYGICIWSGTAHSRIHNNFIEKCRHCISMNSDERVSLVRNAWIYNNDLIPSITNDCSFGVDCHNLVLDMYVIDNNFYCTDGSSGGEAGGFWDGSFYSVFSGNHFYGGYTTHRTAVVERRGSINNGIHVVKNNYVEGGDNLYFYFSGYFPEGEHVEISDNNVYGCAYGVYCPDDTYRSEMFKTLIIKNNTFNEVQYSGIDIILNQAATNVIIENNDIICCNVSGIVVNATNNTIAGGDNPHSAATNTPDSIIISRNNIIDHNLVESTHAGILLNDVVYPIMQNNVINDTNASSGPAIKTTGTSDYELLQNNVSKGSVAATKYVLVGAHESSDATNIEW
jgi:parallel beta-helix repeat protein